MIIKIPQFFLPIYLIRVSKGGEKMWWIRLLPVVFFAVTAFSLISFQSIEIVHAFFDFIQDKHKIK
jgi:hypothetical protein